MKLYVEQEVDNVAVFHNIFFAFTADKSYYQAICNNNIVEDFVYSADFIKLRELSLGYDFKRLLPSLTWLKGLNVSFVARNLWTIMKHTPNIDPE